MRYFFAVLACAALLASLGPARADCFGAYDVDLPTGMYLKWNSSSGKSGQIEFFFTLAGTAVKDEGPQALGGGEHGITRRVVLAPGNADCKDFCNHTANPGGCVTNNRYGS